MTNNIKIHILHTGLVKVDKGLPFYDDFRNTLAFTGLFRSHKNQIILPVSSYLIEHPKGLVLLDTGWNELVRKSQWAELGLQVQINKAYLPAGWSVKEQLEELGYKDSDLDVVILSHLHSDHASGLPLVKHAKKFLVSEEELKAGNTDKLRYIPKMWKDVNLTSFHYENSKLGPFHRAFDLFGDGSIKMIWTPSHSAGLSATLITGADGKSILLASDTGYAQSSIEELKTPGISINRKWSYMSIGWINQMTHSDNVMHTLTNHDVDIHPEVITLPYE